METPTRSSFFGGCIASSSSRLSEGGHPRFRLLRPQEEESADRGRRSTTLRSILHRLLREGKTIYCAKPLNFGYDEDSYSKNFDNGHLTE